MTSNANILNAQLQSLWQRRATLNQAEWAQLYNVVCSVLRNPSGKVRSLLCALPGDADNLDYVHEFFIEKVLATADRPSTVNHVGALKAWYYNYLIDCQRVLPKKVFNLSGKDNDSDDTQEHDAEQIALDKDSWKMASETENADDEASTPETLFESLFATGVEENIVDMVEWALQSSQQLAQASDHLNLDLNQIVAAAEQFLTASDIWTGLHEELSWIQLYLTQNFCPDSDARVSLLALSRQQHIPSYYQKAVKLGINTPKNNADASASFHKSYLGQWLTQLGIALDTSQRLEMRIALKILCRIALSQQATSTTNVTPPLV
ncbi:hypothetical protein CKO12_01135 [Chromatium okenii]|uniref:hypothetical protein n=1 Tax=Chromatium okenii TaxID=61644 RepID=UPI0019086C59|nr:hypothetical protein [Chromatium okenii]MBK1640502.1 hypothetical protein [Chromatium okenii]